MTTWDEKKRKSNLAKHGVDLALAIDFDWYEAVIEEEDSEAYGEQREKATGWIGLTLYVYIYTIRDDEDHAISLRKATPKNTGAIPDDFSPLTEEELAEVRVLRAEAKERALRLADEMTDEEDARLTAAAEADPDNPPLTEEDWKRMRPAHEVHPHLVRRSLLRRRGRPKLASPKQQVTLRIDAEVLEHFKSGGRGWQTAINEVLREAIRRRPLEAALAKPRARRRAR